MRGALYIAGRWRAGAGPAFRSLDPATGAAVWEGRGGDADDAGAAVAAARAALDDWADRPRAARVEIARRYKRELATRLDAFARDLSRETGKPLWEAKAEVASMMAKVEVSVAAAEERAGERESATAFGRAVLRHRPHGVMAVLGPFNFPGHLPNGHILPALIAGDTVVFKPSEETPLAGELMIEAWEAAGLPDGVLNLVQGGRETGAALIAQPIDGLLFTGSAAAGRRFRRAFLDRPEVILALELGGDNPLVVWNAADAAAVAALVVQSAFITTGQRCSCARRLIVPEGDGGDAVVQAVAALGDRLRFGPWDGAEEPFGGPLISPAAAARAARAVEALMARGARAVRPFRVGEGGEAFVTPALLEVDGIEATDEEIFAPVLQVRRAASFDAAVALANATRFGLAAGLVSDDAALWPRFAARSRAGVVNFNRPTTGAAAGLPFGGLGESGNHRPSAYYAADYCAYPVASFEADAVADTAGEIRGLSPVVGAAPAVR